MSLNGESSLAKPLTAEDLPEAVLEQAFHWAVIMGDTQVTSTDRKGFQDWLHAHPQHQAAWQRIQVIEQDFALVRRSAKRSSVTLKRLKHLRRERRRLKLGATLALLLTIGLGSWLGGKSWRHDYATGVAEQALLRLPGGALVHLNANTTLDIDLTAQGPQLYLHNGEILVESASAAPADKPRVHTREAVFTPVGTRFLVDHAPGSSELAVTDGKVNIEAQGHRQLSVAGERWRVDESGVHLQTGAGLTPGAWTDNLIEANDARLAEVLEALGQHRHGWIHYHQDVADLRITGVFRVDDTDSALASLEHTLPIQVQMVTDWLVLIRQK
ncbi:FecR family protein [Ketobacter sp.]|uniref:FecR family protein n=1 Tax=Ketobacter sp. TaxID=2083498 RepID=UPI000F1F9D68|nr:FecR domain-containing protein [Ketobacter sp.]RLU00150.1 MAG: DUF4880 domain-containing protein [Ketobacter sp.]